MDINLKSNEKKDNKILTSLIIILILFIASVGMFKTYPFISKLAKDTSYNYLEKTISNSCFIPSVAGTPISLHTSGATFSCEI